LVFFFFCAGILGASGLPSFSLTRDRLPLFLAGRGVERSSSLFEAFGGVPSYPPRKGRDDSPCGSPDSEPLHPPPPLFGVRDMLFSMVINPPFSSPRICEDSPFFFRRRAESTPLPPLRIAFPSLPPPRSGLPDRSPLPSLLVRFSLLGPAAEIPASLMDQGARNSFLAIRTRFSFVRLLHAQPLFSLLPPSLFDVFFCLHVPPPPPSGRTSPFSPDSFIRIR